MKILFITIAWPSQGERNLYTDLMDEFVKNSHEVYVVTTDNSLTKKEAVLTVEKGISVLRVHSGKIRKANYWRKALSLVTLGDSLSKAINKFYHNINFDLIIGPTPPITLSGLYEKLKHRYKAPFYLLLKDIWPQGSVDLKAIRKYSVVWFYLRFHEKKIYKNADFIGAMSQMNVQYLLDHNTFISPISKVEVCPNSIKPTLNFNHLDKFHIRNKYGIPIDSCVFIFSGNLGKGHGLSFLIKIIKKLSSYHKAFFVIGGSGTHLKKIKEAFKDYSGNNIFIYDWLPKKDFELMLDSSDVGLILLDNKLTIPQFPSRLLSYLNASKPVLCAINTHTDIGAIIDNSNSGKYVTHGDIDSFIEKIKFFSENKNLRLKMGVNAKKLLLENYTVNHSYEIIMKHFKNK